MKYHLEVFFNNQWIKITGGLCSREYGLGFLQALETCVYPHAAMRLVRLSDNKVIYTLGDKANVDLGQMAGFHSAERFRDVAAELIEKAEKLEKLLQNNPRLRNPKDLEISTT